MDELVTRLDPDSHRATEVSGWSGYRTIHDTQHTDPYPAGITRSWVGLAARLGGPHPPSTQHGILVGLFLRVLPERVHRFLLPPNLRNHFWWTNKNVQQIWRQTSLLTTLLYGMTWRVSSFANDVH